jgi:anti-anti-sigma regulatory factor
MAASRSKIVALPAVVDLDAIDGVRDRLLEAIETGPVTVNGAKVERVATNALFMLLSAAESARRNSYSFAIAKPSDAMASAIERLGLGGHFAELTKG